MLWAARQGEVASSGDPEERDHGEPEAGVEGCGEKGDSAEEGFVGFVADQVHGEESAGEPAEEGECVQGPFRDASGGHELALFGFEFVEGEGEESGERDRRVPQGGDDECGEHGGG
jgi:hypothetical protein